eukprot:COSAG02_NODE_33646_length_497_cov_0.349246_1_plen_135_part_10
MNKALVHFQHEAAKRARGSPPEKTMAAGGRGGVEMVEVGVSVLGGVDRHSFLAWAAQRADCTQMVRLHFEREQAAANLEAAAGIGIRPSAGGGGGGGAVFFKQKAAYEVRIRDWSSVGCASVRPDGQHIVTASGD